MCASFESTVALQVKGYDRKGAQFFRFTTPLTEDILHLEVVDTQLFVFTESSCTRFEETTEKSSYVAPDRINCACILPLKVNEHWVAAIGCQDRCIRVVHGTSILQVRHVSLH
jgi:hypothetical protein